MGMRYFRFLIVDFRPELGSIHRFSRPVKGRQAAFPILDSGKYIHQFFQDMHIPRIIFKGVQACLYHLLIYFDNIGFLISSNLMFHCLEIFEGYLLGGGIRLNLLIPLGNRLLGPCFGLSRFLLEEICEGIRRIQLFFRFLGYYCFSLHLRGFDALAKGFRGKHIVPIPIGIPGICLSIRVIERGIWFLSLEEILYRYVFIRIIFVIRDFLTFLISLIYFKFLFFLIYLIYLI